jgi:hypothetical protein
LKPLTPTFYQPAQAVQGPAYSVAFKVIATLISAALAIYGVSVALRFPLLSYGLGVKTLLGAAAIMLGVSYYWFLRSTTTVDARGITQTWLYNREVAWQDIRGAKMIGIPYLGWIFPPRLVVRTGVAFATFNGGSRDVLLEFARISLAFQNKK